MLLADPNRTDEVADEANIDGAVAGVLESKTIPATPQESGGSEVPDGPVCKNCDRRLDQAQVSVCPHCGYYAALGICIDLDEQWEQVARGEAPAPANGETQAEGKAKSAPKSELLTHLQVWIDLVPTWGWQLLGCNAAVLAASGVARVVFSGGLRTFWSVTQLLVGVAIVLTCHFIVYLRAISDDSSYSVLDFLLKPFKLWKGTLRALPKTQRLVASGSCGVSAAIGSILIIGALPYGRLLDWGIKEPPKQNLMGAIVAQAQKVDGNNDGLEDAMEDFAGTAGESVLDKLAGKSVEKNVIVDCLIVGYSVNPKNKREIVSLLIAREFYGNLKYVGRLSEGLDEYVRFDLIDELESIPRPEAFVTVPPYLKANWVQPQYTCRVKCLKETRSGSLVEMELDEMLGKIGG